MNVGDKVVCIDDSVNPKVNMKMFPNWVVEGETYTVRRLEGAFGSEKRVLLEELKNPVSYFPELMGSVEPGFSARRFVSYDEYIMAESAVEELKEEDSLVE